MASLLNFLSPLFTSTTPATAPKLPTLNPLSTPSNNSLSISTNFQQQTPVISSKNEANAYASHEITSVVCPSLAYSNTLYFNAAYNVQVIVDDNEPEERLVNRFRREVMRAGVIQECKRRRYFENKQDEKKRRTRDAAKRNSRRRRGFQPRGPFQNKEETTKVDKKDDDGDNWEMPEGDSPF